MAAFVLGCVCRGAVKNFVVNPPTTMLTTALIRTYWNRDFKPGPYPKTPEEREAAAKKYGILPEDYEPYPDDGFGHGDYPKLPDISTAARDPYYDWDFPEHRRNYGEPLHFNDDIYTEERLNVCEKTRVSYPMMTVVFLSVMAAFAGLYLLSIKYPRSTGTLPKQFPKAGVVHYTFEPADDNKN